jgi:LacI family transcriptional regulator
MDIGYDEDYDILVQPYFPSNSRSRNKLVDLSAEHRIDGSLRLLRAMPTTSLPTTYKVPLVQINLFNRAETVRFVAGDDYQGAYALTEYLISLGHRQIAFLMGSRNMRSSFDRFYGYRAALDRHQVVFQEEPTGDSEFTFDGG